MANDDIGRKLNGLSITIDSDAKNVVANLEKTAKGITKLQSSLEKINNTKLTGLTSKFKTIANSLNSFNMNVNTDTSKFVDLGNAMNKLGNSMTKLTKLDMGEVASQFERINTTIKPFLDTLQANSGVIENFTKTLDLSKVISQYDLMNAKIKTQNERTNLVKINQQKANVQLKIAEKRLANINQKQEGLNTKTKFWSTLWKIGKLGYAFKMVTRLAGKLGDIINLSADFNETLNKFQSATQSQYKDALKFANQLARSFGLSNRTILEYQATFTNMLNSLEGLSDEMANSLSKNLTIMAIDYASLFNTTIESAMEAFQSVLSGKTMSIRSASGIDVTDTTIYEYYKEIGGTKTRTALTQLEKRMLRILAVYQQMNASFAIGDYAETIENFSNQARILKEQIQELGTWVGNVFIGWLEKVLPYINAFVLSLKEVVKTFAFMTGYKYQDPKQSILSAISGEAETATEEVEELQNALGLLSIDKFNVLGSSTTTSKSSDLTLIQEELNKEMTKLQEKMAVVEYKALKISDSILSWLGYTKEVNEETGEVNYVLSDSLNKIEKIANTLISLVSTLVIAKLINKIEEFSTAIVKAETKTKALMTAQQALAKTGIFLLAYSLTTLIKNWKDLNGTQKTAYITLGLIGAGLVTFSKLMQISQKATTLLTTSLKLQKVAVSALSVSLSALVVVGLAKYISEMDKFSSNTKIWVGALMVLAGAFTTVAVAIAAVRSTLSLGTAIPAILTGASIAAVGITSTVKGIQGKIKGYETGGQPKKADFFYANENGQPEYVGSMGGRTTVANNTQIIEGIKQGVIEALQESDTRNNVHLTIDGSRINNSAFARAIMPALKVENKRLGGSGV